MIVSINLDKELVKKIDIIASRNGVSRSMFISECLENSVFAVENLYPEELSVAKTDEVFANGFKILADQIKELAELQKETLRSRENGAKEKN